MKAALATSYGFFATGNNGCSLSNLSTMAEDDGIAIWIACCDAGFAVDGT
jgi:hypothetical protein